MKYKAIVALDHLALKLVQEVGFEKALEKKKGHGYENTQIQEFSFNSEVERRAFFEGLQAVSNGELPDWIASNYADINGTELKIGVIVDVPEPTTTDHHEHEFKGIIVDFRGDNAIVEDGKGELFEIDPERLELVSTFYSLFDYDSKETTTIGLNSLYLEDLKEALIEHIKKSNSVKKMFTQEYISLLNKKDVRDIAVEFSYLVQENKEPFEHESAPFFWVDVPPHIKDESEGYDTWKNIAEFRTEVQAKKFARENFGADTQGKVKIVTP